MIKVGKKYCHILGSYLYDEEIEDFCETCMCKCDSEIEEEEEE
jgi:hypothetical protein